MRIFQLTLIICTLAPIVAAQGNRPVRPTLPELVTLHYPEPVLQTRQRELLPESLESMLAQADLVVRGVITMTNTYMSADQRDLFTDYTVKPTRIMLQRNTPKVRQLGQEFPIVVKRWGGSTTINGVSVTQQDIDLPAFRSGEELILMLHFDKSDEKYELLSTISGAFAVRNDRVVPLIDHPLYHSVRGISAQQFELEMQRQIK
jgi:hypothetical protein